MKNQAIQYLALDVHQATTSATLRDAAGAIRMRATVRTTAHDLLSLVRRDHRSSRNERVELIVGKNKGRSAKESTALDNRFHRTERRFSGVARDAEW